VFAFLLRRALRAVLTLWVVVTFTFVVLRVTGDPALSLLPDDTPPQVVKAYLERWGVDRPLGEQYLGYFRDIARGEFGLSFRDDRPALDHVLERIPKTLQLTGTALAIVLVLGLGAGVAAGLHRGTPLDRAIMAFAVAGYSLPSFFLGLTLIFVFAVNLRVLPSSGSSTAWHLVLPAITLGTTGAAVIARFTRSAMLEVMGQPFVRAARAKGLGRARLMLAHVLPNAAIPVVTVLGFGFGGLIGGSVITETVFAWPGVGRLLVTAVAGRDLNVVQIIVLMLAASMVAANFLVDISYGLLNPRIRLVARENA
jgi:peptide/nickel transport system permease protein